MRSFLALAALPALVFANQPQYYNPRPPPPFPICPDFFSTTITTNLSNPSYGPMTNSVHYQLTVQRINYGRNTYVQGRFYSNVQDLPLTEVTFCQGALSWPGFPALDWAPEFKQRAKYSPRVRGTQPPIVTRTITANDRYWNQTIYGTASRTAYCVTVPSVKPAGHQKADMLWYTKPCALNVTLFGWVEYRNPYNSSEICGAREPRQNPRRKNSVRLLESTNKDMSPTCPTYPWGK